MRFIPWDYCTSNIVIWPLLWYHISVAIIVAIWPYASYREVHDPSPSGYRPHMPRIYSPNARNTILCIHKIAVPALWPHRLTVRTQGSHPCNRGSIPREVTIRDYCPVLEHLTGKRKTFTLRGGFLVVFSHLCKSVPKFIFALGACCSNDIR